MPNYSNNDFSRTQDKLESEACEMTGKAKKTVIDAAHKVSDKVQKLYANASDEITQISSTVTSEVRKNPVQSSILALGIGYLVGRLLSR